MRKAQSLSINTIIIVAIALVVLVVIIVIFSRGSGIFTKDALGCESKGGSCVTSNNDCSGQISSFTCQKIKPICCMDQGGA